MVYKVVGLMSGTSLDGLDVALCLFSETATGWQCSIEYGETIPFSEELMQKLKFAHTLSGEDLITLDLTFASWVGNQVRKICSKQHFTPLLVASHGHTVFHQPAKGITCQIGNGSSIAVNCGFPVVSDFRTADVVLGGQGAPLVPVGDRLLFSEYKACLNIGGIANITFLVDDETIAYDIAPANMVLNHIANRLACSCDFNGEHARGGVMLPELMIRLNRMSFYEDQPPKSLGREWVEKEIFPLLDPDYAPKDLLHTFTHHTAYQIAKAIPGISGDRLLVTGGGAHNRYLIALIQSMITPQIFIPEQSVIDYKEALVFGFLGLLRWLELPNIFASVTGASKDHCSGQIALP